jgi:hypothetical protein
VRAEWPDAQQIAAARLGDASLAHELMEQAIEETKEGLDIHIRTLTGHLIWPRQSEY